MNYGAMAGGVLAVLGGAFGFVLGCLVAFIAGFCLGKYWGSI